MTTFWKTRCWKIWRSRVGARIAALAIVVAAMGAVAAPTVAVAQDLDTFRAQGAIAERWDGYVEARPGAPSAAAALVADVNAKRRAVYEKRAVEQSAESNKPVTADAVGAIYASQIMKNAPRGTFFRQQNGSYVQN